MPLAEAPASILQEKVFALNAAESDGGGGGNKPSGPAEGVLAGTYPAPTFAKLAYSGVTGANANLEGVAGKAAASTAVLSGMEIAVIRGASKVKVATTIKPAEKLFIVNASARPLTARRVVFGAGNSVIDCEVLANGEVILVGPEIAAETIISYDGVAYPLT